MVFKKRSSCWTDEQYFRKTNPMVGNDSVCDEVDVFIVDDMLQEFGVTAQ